MGKGEAMRRPNRQSIRLRGYDYSQPGVYFITMVTHGRAGLFGEITGGEMHLSNLGRIANEHWLAIPEHFPRVELGAYVIMPNHVHGIIVLHTDENGMATNSSPSVGATQWVAPTWVAPTWVAPTQYVAPTPNGPKRGSIGAILGAYKMSVTRRVQHELNETAIWQRNYYEHIVRSEEEYNRIHLYIEANVHNWATDDENPVRSI